MVPYDSMQQLHANPINASRNNRVDKCINRNIEPFKWPLLHDCTKPYATNPTSQTFAVKKKGIPLQVIRYADSIHHVDLAQHEIRRLTLTIV